MVAQRDRAMARFDLQCRPALRHLDDSPYTRRRAQARLPVQTVLFEERRNTLAFWFGCILVTAGVVLHLPMFLMAHDRGYVLADTHHDGGHAEQHPGIHGHVGEHVAAVVVGVGFAGYGLLPRPAEDAPRAPMFD